MFALFAVLLAVGAAAPAADSAAPEDYSGSADYSDLNDYWQGPDGAVCGKISSCCSPSSQGFSLSVLLRPSSTLVVLVEGT